MANKDEKARRLRLSAQAPSVEGARGGKRLASPTRVDSSAWSDLLPMLDAASGDDQIDACLGSIFLRGLDTISRDRCDWRDEAMESLINALQPLFDEYDARVVFDPVGEIAGEVPVHATTKRIGEWEGLMHPGVVRFDSPALRIVVPVAWGIGCPSEAA